MIIPSDIKETFYKVIKGYLPLSDFEQWIYNCDHTESYFWPDDRLILLTLDYNSGHAPHEVRRILFKYISEAEMETWNLLYLLTEAKKKDERLPAILMEFYDLYFGYDFMQDLALSYGLRVEVPYANESWNDLSPSEQQQM
ncbi:MAG: hypothetical protein JST76_14785, partial [Bacteroidetes bacterium]|nr:hypothetical protein [Bacteroidota bacterium]